MITKIDKKNYRFGQLFFYFKYSIVLFLVFTLGFIFLRFPEITASGIVKGMNVCTQMLIPSLFPFLVLSSFIINADLCSKMLGPIQPITSLIFNQREHVAYVFILSMIGGYPVGARMVKSLYEKGIITQDEGQRMLLFCVGPGPAFVISTVGYFMLGLKQAGVIIYISVVISSLLIGIFTRFMKKEDYKYVEDKFNNSEEKRISQALVDAVSQSAGSMFSICVWVVLFSCIIGVADMTIESESLKKAVCSLLEVTTGCKLLCKNASVAVLAGVIGFGGLSTHFQMMSAVIKLKLKVKYFLSARILSGAISMVICQLIMDAARININTISIGTRPEVSYKGTSNSVTMALFVVSLLIVLGDNFIVKIKRIAVDK